MPDNDDDAYQGDRYKVLLTRQSNSIGASSINRAKVMVYWDENSPSSEADSQQWHRLQEEQSSEVLLMFIIGDSDRTLVKRGFEYIIEGFVLGKKLLPDGDSVFSG